MSEIWLEILAIHLHCKVTTKTLLFIQHPENLIQMWKTTAKSSVVLLVLVFICNGYLCAINHQMKIRKYIEAMKKKKILKTSISPPFFCTLFIRVLLHRRLWLQLHDELVAFRVDKLFRQAQEREGCYSNHKGEVELSQGEDLALSKGSSHRLLACQCPMTTPAGIKVLDGGTWPEVTLKESLRDMQELYMRGSL